MSSDIAIALQAAASEHMKTIIAKVREEERDRILANLERAGYSNALAYAVPERYVSKEEIRCVDRDGYIDHDPWDCDGTECRFADRRAEEESAPPGEEAP